MKPSLSTRLLVVLALIIIVAGVIYQFLDVEYEERQVYAPENRQLEYERMHIVERWLGRQGREVEDIRTLQFLESLPGRERTLIIPYALGQYSRLEARQLQQWVLGGGHLIALAPFAIDAGEQAFDLNPHRISTCRDCLTDTLAPPDIEEGKPDTPDWSAEPSTRVPVLGLESQALKLWSEYALEVDRPSNKLKLWQSPDGTSMVARYAFGEGEITLLPANRWLENEQMIEADHARLAMALTRHREGTIHIQHFSVPGGLLRWLWQQAPWFWLALLVLAALWIWSRLPRLGAVLADPEPPANQMRERLRASARFDWRHNQGRQLLEALREEIAVKAQRRYPEWHRLGLQERTRRLHQLCPDLNADAIALLLDAGTIDPADRLIEHIDLQRKLIHAL